MSGGNGSERFHISSSDQPHPERTRAILAAHPEVRDLIGRNPWTGAILVAVVALQLTIAALLGGAGPAYWWLSLLIAYGLGAFANHCLYVVIHEAAHNLIFKRRWQNQLAAIVADIPNIVPAAIGFAVFHLKHHAHQGDYDNDADIARDWEARLVGDRWYMKALWLLLFPIFQLLRPVRMNTQFLFSPFMVLSIGTSIIAATAVAVVLGPNALLYLLASMLFSVGLHPLGARWIQEHYTPEGGQETFSYYGILNVPALNVGYHNEHHDFPSIPWNRLPALKRIAPEFYEPLKSHHSWTRLLFAFVFDPAYSLHSRVVRERQRIEGHQGARSADGAASDPAE